VRQIQRYAPQSIGLRAVLALFAVIATVTGVTATALLIGAMPGGVQAEAGASETARSQVPPPMLDLYRQAAGTCPGLSWTVLAAIGQVESHHGRDAGVSSAGAVGPMQFMPETWVQYGFDASGDGRIDVQDPADAIFSAAGMLCANGATQPGGLRGALWTYNHASWYVDLVVETAELYAAREAHAPTAEAASLVASTNLILTDLARGDIENGRADPRVLQILAGASQIHTIAVSVIQSGHSPFVEGTTRYSNHLLGRAVDIYMVDGQGVSPMNSAARALVVWLLSLEGPNRPSEVGHPFPDLVGEGSFSDDLHLDHVHVGFGPPEGSDGPIFGPIFGPIVGPGS
jgi:transglycosylase-like protein with SLT domain